MMQIVAVRDVHVWCTDPRWFQADEGLTADARRLLTEDELDRNGRFHFERDRAIHLATRWLARNVLSRYEPIPPEEWAFENGPYGKPEIAAALARRLRDHAGRSTESDARTPEASPLRFNLSNTRGLVTCAVTRGREIGVDVEWIGRGAPLEVADRYFAPYEMTTLRSLPPERQPRRFFDYWTLKESYIKARGYGISLPLDKFAFVLDEGGPPRIETDPTLADPNERWQFEQHDPSPEHMLAVCVERLADGNATAPATEPRDAVVSLSWLVPTRLGPVVHPYVTRTPPVVD